MEVVFCVLVQRTIRRGRRNASGTTWLHVTTCRTCSSDTSSGSSVPCPRCCLFFFLHYFADMCMYCRLPRIGGCLFIPRCELCVWQVSWLKFTVVSVLYSRKRNTVLAVSLISVYWPKCNFVWLSGVVVWAWTGGWSSQTESQPLYCRVRPCTSCLCTPTSVAKQYKLVPVLSWRGVNRHWPLVYTLAVSAGAWLRVVESEISTILLASEGLYLLCFVKVTI